MDLTPLQKEYFKITVQDGYSLESSLGHHVLTCENGVYYLDGKRLTEDETAPVAELLQAVTALQDQVLPPLPYRVLAIDIRRGARLGESKIKTMDGLQLYTSTRCEFIYDPRQHRFDNIWQKESNELREELGETDLKKPYIAVQIDGVRKVDLSDVIGDIFPEAEAKALQAAHYWQDVTEE
ncbi:hypothetical protein [uncultured Megasphaera sp.]|uniref:hypothetical protein n=1 Tax=uncultured Megasphaera sp. TaxID=165188 RepID=UPI002597089D|nr:hypothetical protein [uncultured Megasphaera sp.]